MTCNHQLSVCSCAVARSSSTQIYISKPINSFRNLQMKNIRAVDMCWTITNLRFLSIPTSCVVVHLVKHMVPIVARPLSLSLLLSLSKHNKLLDWLLRPVVRSSLAYILAAMSPCLINAHFLQELKVHVLVPWVLFSSDNLHDSCLPWFWQHF